MTPEKTWLDYATAIGTLATPLLVLLLSGIGWRLRQRWERNRDLEDKLRSDRANTYNEVLKPFIMLLTPDLAWQEDPRNKGKDKDKIALRLLLSIEYREQAFRMSLVGSDAVVKAYNDLMQYFYSHPAAADGTPTTQPKEMMELLGEFLLSIRKSMGNEATSLDRWDMLEWFVNDARKYRESR